MSSGKAIGEKNAPRAQILAGDCLQLLHQQVLSQTGINGPVALTFFDPPFNQGKDYAFFDDTAPEAEYWNWVKGVCCQLRELTADGGALYFMQREKNTEQVLSCLRKTGWTLQNLIIWLKHTSAVPSHLRFGKQYQIIAFATKGRRPRTFHRLRIDPPQPAHHKLKRANGLYLTDCWTDIRELTAGFFAGEEALRDEAGGRCHEQQSPLALLARIILSSSGPGDLVLDPCAGSGTTLVAAGQLGRAALGLEVDPKNVRLIERRLAECRAADALAGQREYYRFTQGLEEIWPE